MVKAALPQEAPDNRLPGTLCGVMEILHFPSEIPEKEEEKQEEKKILRGSQPPALKHTNSNGFATLVFTNQHKSHYLQNLTLPKTLTLQDRPNTTD